MSGAQDVAATQFRVVDLATNVAGRFCAKLLAMADADVVAVREVATGDASGENWRDVYLAAYVHTLDVDRGDPAARARVDDLIADADVVITSYDAGRYHGSYDEDAIRALNGTVIHVTVSSFGTTGPYRNWRGTSFVDWASGGYLYTTGEHGREPLAGPEEACGYVAGYTAAQAVEAALAARRRTGRGQHLDLSTMEAMLGADQMSFSRLAVGSPRARQDLSGMWPRGLYPCATGYIFLAVTTDEQFDRLVVAMDKPELAADPRFATVAERHRNAAALDREVVRWLADADADSLAVELQGNKVPAAAVPTTREVLDDPQLHARDFFDHVQIGDRRARMPGNPVREVRPEERDAARVVQSSESSLVEEGGLPLHGGDAPITVLDLTAWWAGPIATRMLADLGARVIRLEPPTGRTDDMRHEGFPHQHMNRHKLSVAVDLRTEEGSEIVRRLADRADVFLHNVRPGIVEKSGVDCVTLMRRNSRLVYVAISGFGQGGPRGEWLSYGTMIEAASSMTTRTGYRDGPPMRLAQALPDAVAGIAGALAALRGLRHRAADGRGASFDLSQLECYLAVCGEAVLEASITDEDPERLGNLSRNGSSPQGVYRCRGDDAWIALSITSDADWERFVDFVQNADLSGDRLRHADERRRAQSEIDGAIARFAESRDAHELAASLQERGVPACPVMSYSDLARDPHLRARDSLVDVRVESGMTGRLPGRLVSSSEPLVDIEGWAPHLGEHTDAVLSEYLGLGDEELSALAARGVIAR